MVKKIKEMSEVELSRAMNFMAGLPLPAPEYDHLGLRFPLDHLERLKCTPILFPLEHMSQYAERDVFRAIASQTLERIRLLFKDIDLEMLPPFDLFTATSIGNLALIALKCHDEKLQQISISILNKIYDWHWEAILAKSN